MIKTLTLTAAIALMAAPLALADSKAIDTRSFDTIEVKGAMNLVYTQGPDRAVAVETDGSDFSDADISVDGDTLVITRVSLEKGGLFGKGTNLKVSDDGKTVRVNGKKVPTYTVRVTSPDLSGVKVSQSSRADVSGIDAGNFEAKSSSSGRLILQGRAADAELAVSSSGDIDATRFQAAMVDISASSSGDITALVSGTGDSRVSASSSGDVTLRSEQAASFTVDASSGADVSMSGACARISISASSGADVDADDLKCAVASVNASSGGDVDAFASDSATGNASSGGDVNFSGNPSNRESNKSSGGDVSFK